MDHKTFLDDKVVYICSPLHDEDEQVMTRNQLKAQQYMKDYLEEYGCKAIAPQAYLPYLLNDSVPKERELAMSFCMQMLSMCDALVICGDHLSDGMRLEIIFAHQHGIPVLSRPENFAAYHEFMETMRYRVEVDKP